MDTKTLIVAALLTTTTPFLSSAALGEQVPEVAIAGLADEKNSLAKTLGIGCTTGAVVGAPVLLGAGIVVGCVGGAIIGWIWRAW